MKIWFGNVKRGILSNFIVSYSPGLLIFKYFIVHCLTFPVNYGYFKTKKGNTKLGGYASCQRYRNNMEDRTNIPYIDDRADGPVSKPGERRLEILVKTILEILGSA